MRQRGFSGIYLLLPVLILGAGVAIYYLSANKQPTKNPVESQPILQQTSTPEQDKFVPGEIIVGIKSGVKYGDAEQLIKSFNLKYTGDKKIDLENKVEIPYSSEDIVGERPVFFTVFVPQGEEEKWIEIFKSKSIVKDASVNHYSYLQNK